MVLTPIVFYGTAYSSGLIPLLLSISLSTVFIFQPDAGQATAFALASVIIFIFNHRLKSNVRILGILFTFSLTLIAWQIPDPLLPIEHVERILHLTFYQGIIILTITLVSIFILHFPFFLASLKKHKLTVSILSLSFSIYLLMQFMVTQFGNFPVPIIGVGAAPVLGRFLMVSFSIITE